MRTDSPTDLDPTSHQHSTACWWDHRQARWTCERSPRHSAPDPLELDQDRHVDVRDMIVVHTALLREFRLAPAAVERVTTGDRRQARRVGRHLDLLCTLMHHHHAGEDELLWPVLSPRLPQPDLACWPSPRPSTPGSSAHSRTSRRAGNGGSPT
jgi:hypothetical protein